MTRRDTRGRRGLAAVELAVVSPLLLVLLLGLWEVGRMVEVMQIMSNAVREGGRQASTGQKTAAQVQAAVVFYMQQNGISAVTTSNVTVSNLTSSGTDPTAASQNDQIQVSVSIPFNSVRWILLNQITTVSTLTASAVWYSMADTPLTVNTSIPTY